MTIRIGDWVQTPEGHIGQVEQIDKEPWENRAGHRRAAYHYYVESPTSGSPIVWWHRVQLKKVKKERTEP